jgi:hypothetical protein
MAKKSRIKSKGKRRTKKVRIEIHRRLGIEEYEATELQAGD